MDSSKNEDRPKGNGYSPRAILPSPREKDVNEHLMINIKKAEKRRTGEKHRLGSMSLKIVLIVAFQLVSSLSMTLVNKAAVQYVSYPVSLLCLQTISTIVILEVSKALKLLSYSSFSWANGGKQFLGVAIAFVVPMVFNMLALKYVSVATVVVFRQVSTALVAIGEFLAFRKKFKKLAVFAIFLGILGSLYYGRSASDFHFLGYMFAFLYACSMAVNALYIKAVFDRLPQMNNWEKTLYQNFEGTPLLVVIALSVESIQGFGENLRTLSIEGWLVILFSCVAGFAVSIAGIFSRTALSPTSFNILGNMSKPLTVLMSFFLFQAETSMDALTGLMMVLLSGALYSFTTQKR